MITVEDRVRVGASPEEAFAFLADFRNLPRWDVGIASASLAKPAGEREVEVGAEYKVVARFLGQRVPMRYRVVRYDAERGVAELHAKTPTVIAKDFITVSERPGGAEIHWRAEFTMRGPLRLSEAVMRPVFQRLADKAMQGLRDAFARGEHTARATA